MRIKPDKYLFCLLFLSCILFILPNGLYHTVGKDEPKYLETAYEMLNRNDYLVPIFNGKLRFDKPPLTYWLIILGYKTFGKNEFGGRFFISIMGVLSVLTLYLWLKKKKMEFAFWAAFSQLSTLYFVAFSSIAMPDMPLLFFLQASAISLFEGKILMGAVFSSLAVLSKGLIGMGIPLLIWSIFKLIRKEFLKEWNNFLKFFIISLTLSSPWFVLMTVKFGVQFFESFFLYHHFKRFYSGISGHSFQWWYYLVNFWWAFFPVSLFLPAAFFKILKSERKEELLLFSVIGFVSIFFIFQVAKTKLIHYLLPALPYACIIVGCVFHKSKLFKKLNIVAFFAFCMLKWIALPLINPGNKDYNLAKTLVSLNRSKCAVYSYKKLPYGVIFYTHSSIQLINSKKCPKKSCCILLIPKSSQIVVFYWR